MVHLHTNPERKAVGHEAPLFRSNVLQKACKAQTVKKI